MLLAVATILFASCAPKPEATWANYDLLTDDQKTTLVTQIKDSLDLLFADCESQCKAKCEEAVEGVEVILTEEELAKQAACAEFKARWATFAEMTLEQKKAILDEILAVKCCKGEAEGEGCCKEEGEGCKKEGEGCGGK